MLRFSHLVILVIAFISCSQNENTLLKRDISPSLDTKNRVEINSTNFIEIDTSGILLFPLLVSEKENVGGSLYSNKVNGSSYWNMLFLNSRTNEYQLLSDKKMLIQSYFVPSTKNGVLELNQNPNYIFYTIVTDDYNKDKNLSGDDAEYLFVSDKFGKNLKQISPSNYKLLNWQYVKSSNKVVMSVQKDSDSNGKFEQADEVTTFEIDIEKDAGAKETFSSELKDKLKSLYDRDWKPIKK